MTSNKDKNKKANEILYAFSIIGIIPLMAILILRINNPYSQVLYYLYNKVAFLPSITSVSYTHLDVYKRQVLPTEGTA